MSTEQNNSNSQPQSRHPPWHGPVGEAKLKVFNSLTSTKVAVVPANGNVVNWYTCGPTVYDSAHLGHARAYVTFDIIRRIMSDYMKYNVFYVMNITDLDDKIIIRSRRNYLVDKYETEAKTIEEVYKFITDAFTTSVQKAQAKYDNLVADYEKAVTTNKYVAESKTAMEEENAKLKMIQNEAETFQNVYKRVMNDKLSLKDAVHQLVESGRSALSEALDKLYGATVTDHSIFKAHAARYEAEFIEDMRALNVRDADALTRVTEYVPQIVQFVEDIIKNGFAYESNGSVYFDTGAFVSAGHHYAKLSPWCVGNINLTEAGEGALSEGKGSEKKNPGDFALWKQSKAGEPHWPSPWGQGRPGWHIECSAMASDLLGTNFDVHSGGEDLKFPHHDNEMAQSEGASGCHQWVNHFWHAGHLNIQGLKMSKSLKNFITIRQILEQYDGRTVRFLFLMQPWDGGMNFSTDALNGAKTKEKEFNEFFANTQAAMRVRSNLGSTSQLWDTADRNFHGAFVKAREAIHNALYDNFNYPLALTTLSDIVHDTNNYIRLNPDSYKFIILQQVVRYVDQMLRVFGVMGDGEVGFVSGSSNKGSEQILDAICQFRDLIREIARAKKPHTDILQACDAFRDEAMIECGVRMEDVTGKPSVWKLDDPVKLKKEREEKKREELNNRLTKAMNKLEKVKKDLEKVTEAKVSGKEFFASQTDKYGQFDENGKPTHDAAGTELPKSALKTIAKTFESRQKAYLDLQGKIAKDANYIQNLETEQQQLQQQIVELEALVKQNDS